jgi:Tol biopolymer transport system component
MLSQTDEYLGNYALGAGSPDRAVFEELETLYSIAIDGAQRVQLSLEDWLVDGLIAIDGTNVVFKAHFKDVGARELFRVPIDGSQPAVSLLPGSQRYITSFKILNSSTVAYTSWGHGFFVVPLAGGQPPLLLNPGGVAGQEGVSSFDLHPNGQDLVFLSDDDTVRQFELYLVPLDGSRAPRKLSAPLPAGLDVHDSVPTPDGQGVVYLAGTWTGGRRDIFRAPLHGGGPVLQLNEPVLSDDAVGDVLGFRAASASLPASGERVVYRADQDADESFDLYSADAHGAGAPLLLTARLPNVLPDFVFSPSGKQIVFQTRGAQFALHSVSAAGGEDPIELDSSPVEFPFPFEVSPDGNRVVYRKSVVGANSPLRYFALRSASLDGFLPPITLHAAMPAGRTVTDFRLSADGRFAVFRADQGENGLFTLYRTPLDGSTAPLQLDSPQISGGDVSSFQISSTSGTGRQRPRVVYLADRTVDGKNELYSVRLDGGNAGRPDKLNAPLPTSGDVTGFVISADGRLVVYRANGASSGAFDLFSVPSDGPRPALRRSSGETRSDVVQLTTLPSSRRVETDFVLSADGTQVIYRANPTAGILELFRVPADGSAAPTPLSGTLSPGSDVTSFALSPDQTTVVYLADPRSHDVIEPFAVPLAGGPTVALDTMPTFGDVSSFRIDPESKRVAYLADRNADAVFELFAVPLDGSGPLERLSRALTAGGDVQPDYALLSGGRALYRADQEQDEAFELFLSLDLPRTKRSW